MITLLKVVILVFGGGFGFYIVGLLRGYRKGYEFARSLVGAHKLPPYDKLHEDLP